MLADTSHLIYYGHKKFEFKYWMNKYGQGV